MPVASAVGFSLAFACGKVGLQIKTPLQVAEENGYDQIGKLLRQHALITE